MAFVTATPVDRGSSGRHRNLHQQPQSQSRRVQDTTKAMTSVVPTVGMEQNKS